MRYGNPANVKLSANRWRTFNGERYECWCIEWSNARAKEYRAAGISVRRVDGELFLRPADFDCALAIDEGRVHLAKRIGEAS